MEDIRKSIFNGAGYVRTRSQVKSQLCIERSLLAADWKVGVMKTSRFTPPLPPPTVLIRPKSFVCFNKLGHESRQLNFTTEAYVAFNKSVTPLVVFALFCALAHLLFC